MAVTCGRGCGSSTPRSRSGCRASGGRLRRHPWGRAGPSGPLSLFVLAPAAFSVPTPSMPSSAGIHAGGRRVGGTSYKHPAPAEARGGGRDDHIAPKRQRAVALWSDVVALATATILRQSAGCPCRFGAKWSFSPPPPQQNCRADQPHEAAGAKRRQAWRKPTAQGRCAGRPARKSSAGLRRDLARRLTLVAAVRAAVQLVERRERERGWGRVRGRRRRRSARRSACPTACR